MRNSGAIQARGGGQSAPAGPRPQTAARDACRSNSSGLARNEPLQAKRPLASRPLKTSAPIAYHSVWALTLILLTVGLCMMLSVSLATAFARAGVDKFLYVKQQAMVAGLGLVVLVVISRLDYRKWGKISLLGLGAVVLSLLAIHLPGLSRSANGSARWIPLGPYSFQPSEFAKLLVVLSGAHLLAGKRVRGGDSSL